MIPFLISMMTLLTAIPFPQSILIISFSSLPWIYFFLRDLRSFVLPLSHQS
jgi:hypothetical protein